MGKQLLHASNFECHVFELRDGWWAVRIDGLGPRVTLTTDTRTDAPLYLPEDALSAAARYANSYIEKLANADDR